MVFIDTHTHLYLNAFEKDRAEVMQRAIDSGVAAVFLPHVDSETTEAMLDLEREWPKHAFAMMGVHPCSITADYEKELAHARRWLERRTFAAIGEIGIDLYWDKTFFEQQKLAFRTQCDWALEYELPIVIHARDSTDVLIDLLREIGDPGLKGIFHCFTGTADQAEKIVDLGFKLGIGGVVTFKNGGLDKTLEHISLEDIVLETDAPYLTPTPYRGKRNESSYIPLIAEKVATEKKVTIQEVADTTTRNAKAVFDQPFLK